MFLDILELRTKNKNINLGKKDYIKWSQILEKVSVNVPWKSFKKNCKKVQKHEIVKNLWRIPRPKQSILSNV